MPLIGVLTDPRLWAHTPRQPGRWCGCALTWASGVYWDCLSGVHSLGAEGVGAQEAMGCCWDFSKQLLSACIFSFSFWEIPPIQAPWSKQVPGLSHSPAWLSPKNLAADPAALAGGFSHPVPLAGPRDVIVLKHSSYHLIFQCPLQFLVSDLHICWNTIGCSLCSSDQLGVSLVPRGCGLCSHLSCLHLLS